MRGLPSKVTKLITIGTQIVCADNSGAKELEVINVPKRASKLRTRPSAGIGDLVIVSVKKGKPDVRKKVMKAVIVRQKKEFRRLTGIRMKFEDNAAIIVDDAGLPKGTEVKGAIAREVVMRFPKIAGVTSIIV